MRPRVYRKGFSKHLRRFLDEDDDDDDEWADQVIGTYDCPDGGPPNGRDPGPTQQGGDAS
jgi:hypothetical protein